MYHERGCGSVVERPLCMLGAGHDAEGPDFDHPLLHHFGTFYHFFGAQMVLLMYAVILFQQNVSQKSLVPELWWLWYNTASAKRSRVQNPSFSENAQIILETSMISYLLSRYAC